jgi:hypothetical protein
VVAAWRPFWARAAGEKKNEDLRCRARYIEKKKKNNPNTG